MTVKRFCDLALAVTVLALSAPVFAVVAVVQRWQGVPILWRSPRVGMGGRIFELLSFTTMWIRQAGEGPVRLTRVGRVLRTFSVDHLPMLINVVRGDMSVVGPRPAEPDRVVWDDPVWRRVLSVRPGVVSYAVVVLARSYNHSSAQRRLELEAAYVERAGVRFDLALLAGAAGAFVRSWGNVKARGRPRRST